MRTTGVAPAAPATERDAARERTLRQRYPDLTDAEIANWRTYAPATFDDPAERRHLPPFHEIVEHLNATDPDTWWAGPTFRSTDANGATCHCVLSHVFEAWGEKGMGEFEKFSTSYSIGRANDGEDQRYPQPHAKDRSLAFLVALAAGNELTTYESMEAEFIFHTRNDPTINDAAPHTASTTEKNGTPR